MSVNSNPGDPRPARRIEQVGDAVGGRAGHVAFSITTYRSALTGRGRRRGDAPDAEVRSPASVGLPEIAAGDDLAPLIADAIDAASMATSSSSRRRSCRRPKAPSSTSPPSSRRRSPPSTPRRWDKDARLVEVVLSEAAADRADERTAADHRDPPRVRVRQQRRRRVVERGGGAGRRAPARSRRLGPPPARRASASSASTWR